MSEEIIAFQGEVMLLNWNESKQGRTAVFLLDEESEQHPFKKFTTKKGRRAGQRFMAVLVELNDDETPVVQEKPKGGPLSKSAAMLCENPEFQKFIRLRYSVSDHHESVAEMVRSICNVRSRADIDHNSAAAMRFHELMREYRQWGGTE